MEENNQPDFTKYMLIPKWMVIALVLTIVIFFAYDVYSSWDWKSTKDCTQWGPATQDDLAKGIDCEEIRGCVDIESNLNTQVQECKCLKGNETTTFNKRCDAKVKLERFTGGEVINYEGI